MRTTEDILAPPGESDVARALDLFAASVHAAYADRLSGLFLFGSRARGDFEPFSDADVAVVLNDSDWALVSETRRLARLANEVLIETGVEIQAWPVSQAAWDDPAHHAETALIENMRRDAKPIVGGQAVGKLLGHEGQP